MTANNSAGTYTEELDRSFQAKTVSPTTAVIVGTAPSGIANKPVLYDSVEDFKLKCGNVHPRFHRTRYAAVRMLRTGASLYYHRVVSPDAKTAVVFLTVDDVTAVKPSIALSVHSNSNGVPDGIISPDTELVFDPALPATSNIIGAFYLSSPGDWGSDLELYVGPKIRRGATVPDDDSLFIVTEDRGDVFRTYEVCLDYRLADNGDQLFIETVLARKSNNLRFKLNPHFDISKMKFLTSATTKVLGGSQGSPVTSGMLINALDQYADPELLKCNLFVNAGIINDDFQRKLDAVARVRNDAFAILDLPADAVSTADAINYRRNVLRIDSSFSALYGPNAVIYDEVNDMEVEVSPSVVVAPVFAHNDKVAFLWMAPAGLRRGKLDILRLVHAYGLPDRNALEDNNINPLRFIADEEGHFVWGADSLQMAKSATRQIPVRRLMSYIETTAAAASLVGTFDANDRNLWYKLYDIVESVMLPCKRSRGVYWYNIVCDETVNTPDVIANGDVVLQVYVDPTMYAKRILIQTVINKTGSRSTATYINKE